MDFQDKDEIPKQNNGVNCNCKQGHTTCCKKNKLFQIITIRICKRMILVNMSNICSTHGLVNYIHPIRMQQMVESKAFNMSCEALVRIMEKLRSNISVISNNQHWQARVCSVQPAIWFHHGDRTHDECFPKAICVHPEPRGAEHELTLRHVKIVITLALLVVCVHYCTIEC